ncbi:neuronal acetylcholine receptor subunit alpha-6-like [Glandiceps talaboti]
MMNHITVRCLIAIFLLAGDVFCGAAYRKRLYHDLFRSHNGMNLPLPKTGPVALTFRPNIHRIISKDPASSTVKLEMYLYYSWNDPALVWDSSEYDGTERLVVPMKKIWTPSTDMQLYSGTESFASTTAKQFASLKSSGDIFLFYHTISEVPCDQGENGTTSCTIKYTMSNYMADEVAVDELQEEASDIHSSIDNGLDWGVVTAKRYREVINYACCPETFHNMVIELVFDDTKMEKWANNGDLK